MLFGRCIKNKLTRFKTYLGIRKYLQQTNNSHILDRWTEHEELKMWIKQRIALFQPARVHLCDGSENEFQELLELQVHQGTLIKLNEKLRPNSYLARSDKSDVARLETSTFICSDSELDAGPTNIQKDPLFMTNEMNKLFENSMRGRTMFVIPFCMGPLNSPMSRIGVQITDSPYVVASMKIMTRMGTSVLKILGKDGDFIPCIHSCGYPLSRGQVDVPQPSNDLKYVVHFPEQQRIWSFGSGYGGNALLGKKCFALRIASAMANENNQLAEHMLIIGVTNPQGKKKYFVAAFPSACGKTNMAMMKPLLPGWKVECIGDDIAQMKINPKDGKLYAINPEAGFFGVAPGTSSKTNPYAMESIRRDTIFTNVAIKPDGDVWQEGMTDKVPDRLVTWLRTEQTNEDALESVAHPNSRFCSPISLCPVLDPKQDDPEGVPIDGIIFGGRRSHVIPLVFQAKDWQHGVFIGSVMSSETTPAAAGRQGILRADPFAMKPFCGYNMADYFKHQLDFAETSNAKMNKLPKIFHVNWFKKRQNKFVQPGFGDNIRVLKQIFERCDSENNDNAEISPIGLLPKRDSIDISGLNISSDDMEFLFKIDPREWRSETERYREFHSIFTKEKFPKALVYELDSLQRQFTQSPKK